MVYGRESFHGLTSCQSAERQGIRDIWNQEEAVAIAC